jgi:hypothetical protein
MGPPHRMNRSLAVDSVLNHSTIGLSGQNRNRGPSICASSVFSRTCRLKNYCQRPRWPRWATSSKRECRRGGCSWMEGDIVLFGRPHRWQSTQAHVSRLWASNRLITRFWTRSWRIKGGTQGRILDEGCASEKFLNAYKTGQWPYRTEQPSDFKKGLALCAMSEASSPQVAIAFDNRRSSKVECPCFPRRCPRLISALPFRTRQASSPGRRPLRNSHPIASEGGSQCPNRPGRRWRIS